MENRPDVIIHMPQDDRGDPELGFSILKPADVVVYGMKFGICSSGVHTRKELGRSRSIHSVYSAEAYDFNHALEHDSTTSPHFTRVLSYSGRHTRTPNIQ